MASAWRSILLMTLCLVSGSIRAQGDEALGESDRAAIRRVISQQLEAFQHDDEVGAFSFAAPSIQAQFKTPAEFMRMVRSGYQAVYRPRSTRFLEAFVHGGRVVQPLEVVTPEASVLIALYLMERQTDGTWRISGCVLGASRAQTV